MLKKLKNNYWFQCAVEALVTVCIYSTILYLGLTTLRIVINALSN
jgi:hypothetical protein